MFYMMVIFWLLALITYVLYEYWWMISCAVLALLYLILYLYGIGDGMFRSNRAVKEDNNDMKKEENSEYIIASEGDKKTIISPEVTVKGNINSSGIIIIYGKVLGDIISDGGFIQVMHGGCIHGDVSGREVIVDGNISGECRADRIDIKENGNLEGKIIYNILSVERGGCLSGEIVKVNNELEKDTALISDINNAEKKHLKLDEPPESLDIVTN